MNKITPQVKDVWRSKKDDAVDFKVLGVDLDFVWCARFMGTPKEYFTIPSKWLMTDYQLIERDGKPYKKERTGEELVGCLCYLSDENSLSGLVRLVKSYKKELGYYDGFHYWEFAREIPKEELLKLKNFEGNEYKQDLVHPRESKQPTKGIRTIEGVGAYDFVSPKRGE